MTVKIYINDDNTATFICPKCQKTSVKDLSKYLERNTSTRLKAKCKCGHAYTVFIEKRKKFRKQTDLVGLYKFYPEHSEGREYSGSMKVKNLSFSGIRIKLSVPPLFKEGDILEIEFRLDDSNRSIIKKKVAVKNINDLDVGLAYASPQAHDSVLGFYIFN